LLVFRNLKHLFFANIQQYVHNRTYLLDIFFFASFDVEQLKKTPVFCVKNTGVLEKKHLCFERKTSLFFQEKLLGKIGG